MFAVLLIYVAHCIMTGWTQNFAVRLNNSINSNLKEGRLEIYYSGSWGTVCEHLFTDANVRVACASLRWGYIGTSIRNQYGAGSGPIWLDDVICNGNESGIEQCVHSPWGQHNCGHHNDIAISCVCEVNNFSGRTGTISSLNYPMAYINNLDCYSFISVLPARLLRITFLTFNTQPSFDYVTITCATGNAFASPRYSGSQIPEVLTITSCTLVTVYFHTDSSTTNTGFSLTFQTKSECTYGDFFGPAGYISSPNFPNAYSSNIDCSSYIISPTGQTIIITFQSFDTESCCDWVTLTCESGKDFTSPRFSGAELPPVLTILSCNRVNVNFYTDDSAARTGFSLIYNVTSDIVMGGISNKPSNMFPRSDKNDSVIFNCTTATKYLPWWTTKRITGGNVTITNSTCGVIASVSYSSWFRTESLGPGSCNLILVAPAASIYLLAGSFVCTDSTLSTARALLAPINLELRLTKGVNSSAAVTDIMRDEEIRIACNPSFATSSSLIFTYSLYSGGPLVQMRIISTYWTLQGNVISRTANSSSYVLVKAPVGSFPRYTCNIVCNFISKISDITGNSSIEISFSTENVEVLYWPTEDNMRITGDYQGQILPSALLKCDAAANPQATYTWIDESNGNITKGPTITINHGGKYTCNASNIIRGQYYQQSKSVILQVVEDDINRLKLAAIILGALLGAAVLTIVILAVLFFRKNRQPKQNSDVGHINQGNEHELQQRSRGSNRYEYDNAVREDVAKTEYENLDGSQRPANIPTVYEELRKPR